jgi:O-antigen/teichoic acid export membrane protein
LDIALQGDAPATFRTMFRYFNLVMVFAILGLSLFGADVLRVMAAPSFLKAAAVIPVIGLSYLFASYRQFSYVGFWVKTETRPVARLTALSDGLNLLANIALIPRFGIWGAAWATVLAYGVEFVVGMVMSERRYPVTYAWRPILGPLLGATGLYLAVSMASQKLSLTASLGLKSLALLAFPALSVAAGGLLPEELRTLIKLAARPLHTIQVVYRES